VNNVKIRGLPRPLFENTRTSDKNFETARWRKHRETRLSRQLIFFTLYFNQHQGSPCKSAGTTTTIISNGI